MKQWRLNRVINTSRSLGWSLGLVVAVGLSLALGILLAQVYSREHDDLQSAAAKEAGIALDMLAAIHTSAMRNRRTIEDGDSAINTLNGTMEQFSAGGHDVKLWMVMGPKVVEFQKARKQDEVEGPRDAIDHQAIDTGVALQSIDASLLRQVRPVIYGQGLATAQSCGGCHETMMGIKSGEVIGAYSAQIDLRPRAALLGKALKTEVIVTLAAIAALGALIVAMVGWLVLRPLKRMQDATDAMADGDYSAPISNTDRRDEIGALARALAVFKERLADRKRLERELGAERERGINAEQASARHRVSSATREREREVRREARRELSDRFEASVAGIVGAVQGAAMSLARSADQLVSAADQASSEATTIAYASHRASDNVQRVAMATEELSQSIEVIAGQVIRQSNLTIAANAQSEQGAQTVLRLTEKAHNIRRILSLVQGVASQTDLLALNATIESARAGQAGRGFAVVAAEVKTLAQKTTASVSEIDELVKSVSGEVGHTVSSIGEVCQSLGLVRDIATDLAASVSQQQSVASDISRHAATAAEGTNQVDRSISELAAAAKLAGDLAREVRGLSASLSDQAELLHSAAGGFIEHLRSPGSRAAA